LIPSFHLYLQKKATESIVQTISVGQGYTFDLEEVELLRKYTVEIFSAISNKSYECDLEEMAYFLVPLKFNIHGEIGRDSFDWTEIGYVVDGQTPQLDLEHLEQYVDRIVVDQSDSFRRYIFHQARRDLTPASEFPPGYHGREVGCKNFADYYEQVLLRVPENMDQPLIEVEKFTKVLNYLSPIVNLEAKAPRRSAQYLIPEFCHLYPISASMYRTATLMPSIMMHIDAVLLVREVNEKLETDIDETLLLEAFTTPSANMDADYERLETLGDSFLKFVATIRLYIMFPQCHEGQLHCQRIRIICNKALYRGARRLQLYKHITSQPFNRRRWRPPHFKLSTDNEEDLRIKLRRHELSDKTLADIVEATMGAAYLAGGVELGLKSAIALQIPFDHMTEWKHFNETYTESRAQLKARVKEASKRHLKLDHLEEITGYRFRNPLLVIEALTHASEPNSTVPCYQRLEFLGDGILDFLVVNYLFHKYPDYEPGRMTDIKDGCVNNRVLGAMCLEMGLNKHIIHFSSKLMGAITQFAREVELIKDSGEDIGEYWSDLDVPKVLSDVVESVLGAIFVDSGFDFDTVQKSFNFFMIPFFDKYVQPDILKVHPLKTLTTGLQKIHCDGLLLR
jgi:endoribonuclease Dicer